MSGAYLLPAAALAVAVLLLLGWAWRRRRRSPSRVTPLAAYAKQKKGGRQSCSFCKKKVAAKELAFYARHGQVLGVCRACRPQAERQALLRL